MSLATFLGVAGFGVGVTLLQILVSVLLAVVLFAAAKKLKGWLRVAAIIFGVLAVIGIIISLIVLLAVIALAGFT